MVLLEELEVYKIAMDISKDVAEIVFIWSIFHKDTLGKQLIRAADSIALNISEGYGRYYFKENKKFCYYSRGSAYETKCGLQIAKNRNLIDQQKFDNINIQLQTFLKLLNGYIRSINQLASN